MKYSHTLSVLIIVIHFTAGVYGQSSLQDHIDSLLDNRLPPSEVGKLRSLLEQNANLQGWTCYYTKKGYGHYQSGKNDLAKQTLLKGLEYWKKSDKTYTRDENCLLQLYYTLGLLYRQSKEYAQSTDYTLKAMEIEQKYPYKYRSYFLGTIAGNHLALGNDEKALALYQEMLKDSVYTALAQPHVVTLTRMGVLYSRDYLDQPDSALYYLKQAELESYKKDYTKNLVAIYTNLGDLYKISDTDSALYYFRRAKRLYPRYTFEPNISPTYLDLTIEVNNAYIDIQENRSGQAIERLHKVIDTLEGRAGNKEDRDLLLAAFDHLALGYEDIMQYDKAMKTLRNKEEFLRDFHELELEKELEKVEVAYETRQKENQIDMLESETRNQDLKIRSQRTLLIGSGLIVLFISLFVLLWYRQRNLKSKLEKISLEQRLLRTQMDPHFIFNTLQHAILLSEKDSDKTKDFLEDFGSLLRTNLSNSRRAFVSLEDELKALRHYLALETSLRGNFVYHIDVEPEIDEEFTQIPPMLIQPLVENALKHGINQQEKGEIKVLIRRASDEQIICEVKDNGPGFEQPAEGDSEKEFGGFALNILKERLELLNKKMADRSIRIEPPENKNCRWNSVQIPIPFRSLN